VAQLGHPEPELPEGTDFGTTVCSWTDPTVLQPDDFGLNPTMFSHNN